MIRRWLRKASQGPEIGNTVEDTLELSGIPKPSKLLAQMVAFKVAQIPASDKYCGDSDGYMRVDLELEGGRVLKIAGWFFRMSRADRVSIGMPGPPVYRTVNLDWEEHLIVLQQLKALKDRSWARRSAERSRINQENSLSILDHLVGTTQQGDS